REIRRFRAQQDACAPGTEAHVPALGEDRDRASAHGREPRAGSAVARVARVFHREPAAMKSRRFDLIVFDWDGTLMDSAAAIVASLQGACRALGLPVPDDGQARYIIGLGLHDALSHILPGLDAAQYPRVVDRYRHHFQALDGGTALFPGV